MNLEDIIDMWAEDCKIDQTNIINENVKIPQLHSKYYTIYMQERIKLKKFTADFKKMKLEKYEFYQNPTKDKVKLGWVVPAQGRLLKQDLSTYLDGDEQLLQLELKLGIQHEKVDFLKSIIDNIHSRSFLIKNIIEEKKFLNGVV